MTKDEYLAHPAAVYRVANMSGSDNPARKSGSTPVWPTINAGL